MITYILTKHDTEMYVKYNLVVCRVRNELCYGMHEP